MVSPVSIDVVIPVYGGVDTLRSVVSEVLMGAEGTTEGGIDYVINEIILVWDHGIDDSPTVMRELERESAQVRSVWLMKNFGQHAATLAGIASSGSEWIVTIDEDGQHDPSYIPKMLDHAFAERCRLVYFSPTNKPPHGMVRNAGSRFAKWIFRVLSAGHAAESFNSFRLVHGEAARTVSAYTGPGVYLDVALGWVCATMTTCPGLVRTEGRPATSYTYRKLASHAFKMGVSSGTRPLRLIAMFGLVLGVIGFLLAGIVVYERIFQAIPVQGWTSMMIVVLITGGAILLSLSVIAEYLGIAVSAAMGKPLYALGKPDSEVFGEPRIDS